MANRKIELEDEILGGQGPLTKEEESALSDYFRKRKNIAKQTLVKRTSFPKKKQENVIQ